MNAHDEWRAVNLGEQWGISNRREIFCLISKNNPHAERYARLIALAPVMYRALYRASKLGIFLDWANEAGLTAGQWRKRMAAIAVLDGSLLAAVTKWGEQYEL